MNIFWGFGQIFPTNFESFVFFVFWGERVGVRQKNIGSSMFFSVYFTGNIVGSLSLR